MLGHKLHILLFLLLEKLAETRYFRTAMFSRKVLL